MPLLLTSPPYPDESGLGYYRRLAAANALTKWRELAHLANVGRYKTSLFNNPQFVASQLELETDWTQHASNQDEKSRELSRMRRQRYDAICPHCLNEASYLRQCWEHAFVTACPTHGCALIEKCPGCNGWLSTEREHIEQCPCGYDLLTAKTDKAPRTHLWLSSLLSGEAAPAGFPALTNVDSSALSGLVKLLCLHANAAAPTATRNTALPATVEAAQEFLAPLDELMVQWPNGFEAHVKARIEAGSPSARTVNSLLGHWLRELRKLAEHPPLSIFLDVTLNVCQKHFNGIMGINDKTHAPADQNFKRLSEAASLLEVSRDTLRKAMVRGDCTYRTMRYGTKGETFEVSLQEISRIQSKRAAWVDENTACAYLGITPAVLNSMAQSSVIEADKSWRADIYKAGPFNRHSLKQCYESMKALSNCTQPSEDTVAWSALTSRRMGDRSAIEAVMKAAACGEIRAVTVGRILGDFEFLRSDISRYFGTPLLEAGMSISQLSKATGWKDESISHWIQQKLLECEQVSLRGQPCRVITPEQLLRFRKTYLPLAELASAIGTRSSSLADKLAGVEILGTKLEATGARRGGLIRIEDLGRLAIAGLAASRGELFGQQSLL